MKRLLKKTARCALAALCACFVWPAQSVHADDGVTGFDAMLGIFESLSALPLEERDAAGASLMQAVQSVERLRSRASSISGGRPFSEDVLERRGLNAQAGESIDGFIYGQAGYPQAALLIGSAGNGREHGCGPIAAFNALILLSRRGMAGLPGIPEMPRIEDIIAGIEIMGGFTNSGLMGTNPQVLAQYLGGLGLDARVSYLPAGMDGQIRESLGGAAILLYLGRAAGGGTYWHYVAAAYSGGGFELYNVGARDTAPRAFASVDEWMERTAAGAALALVTFAHPGTGAPGIGVSPTTNARTAHR